MVSSNHTFNQYEDCIEKNDVTLADKITDIVALPSHQVGTHFHINNFLYILNINIIRNILYIYRE
jgi:hypothetical protein